ncbi:MULTISPECIES: hypothetical protein [Prosthecochloris]|uniref:Uncharacterized protein n=1 Tax=Prosthecochloris vibrioformis TaxID=1098 RepID=A0A5C4S1C1_PROVB|nr:MULTISPECIES: hypothetical protein [Prosthecochloris]ANT64971.1 hypothetical protein Ptc2401_01198 [Prosthecochloris sp. CIB 2401]TNJ36958.1 hypothetical protein FGF68_05125 [Prosthecochloris vibrioformis]
MDLLDFIPFRKEMEKAYHGLTDNANHTSEHPVFDELKVRRYALPMSEIANFISHKADLWIGWDLKSEKTAIGGMTVIQTNVSSFALLGTRIEATFGLSEEKDRNGKPITTLNAKASTNIASRGDLGESRRVIRMMVSAVDFEFRKAMIKEDDYFLLSLDPRGSTNALQEIFDNSKLKSTPATSKKTAQPIAFTPSGSSMQAASATNGTATPPPAPGNGSSSSSKRKVTVIKLNK